MSRDLTPGTRIRVALVGNPWPERAGARGCIAQVPVEYGDVYPVHGLGPNEVIVKLDNDPLASEDQPVMHHWWSCVMDRRNVVRQRSCSICRGRGKLPDRVVSRRLVTGGPCQVCDASGWVDDA